MPYVRFLKHATASAHKVTQDLATAIALLGMMSSLGSAIGSAVAAAVWGHEMPKNLTKQLSGLLTPAQIQAIYKSITKARTQPHIVRTGVIKAYNDTVVHLYTPALVVSLLTIGAALLTRKYVIWHHVAHNETLTGSFVQLPPGQQA